MNDYNKFLDKKKQLNIDTGLIEIPELNSHLFDFQKAIVRWALRRGRAAIFADCGLGKTIMQLEWAVRVPGNVLILAPLAVAQQTVEEGAKFGINLNYAKDQSEVTQKITITNYERLEKFNSEHFNAIVLDESSILKSYDGSTRTTIIQSFAKTQFKLACTATPAPNDFMELGNHAEFLGVMSRTEMLSMFFVHDGGETQKWRLKGHAESEFWKWICQWAVNMRKPSDLGFSDENYKIPALNIQEVKVQINKAMDGFLFAMEASTLQERQQARRESVADRAAQAAGLIMSKPKEQWLVWCNLNCEADELKKHLKDAVEVSGSDDIETKQERMLGFSHGKVRTLITKPSIAGFGMNWQNCANVVFLGLSDSYEEFYQAVRRCWRFGQTRTVNVYVVIASTEGAVVRNIARKEEDSRRMADEMVNHMTEFQKDLISGTTKDTMTYKTEKAVGKNWELHLGDCVDVVKSLKDESIDFTIFSPPFSSLYTYSNSDRDMGNSSNDEEFMEHFDFLIADLYRVTRPGRLASFHCMNLPTSKQNNGYIGIRDFRGDLIRAFQARGWIYHSEVVIWKDPVIAMQRTKALGLLHKQLKKDSCMSRQGIPDYLVTMRKPGENTKRVTNTNESFPVQRWQQYASPVWMDINPSDTLQFRTAREHNDERHICPLQLQVIQRALELWSAPGDVVLSPFAGIGSEGYQSVKMGRKFVGAELKESYFKQAKKNLNSAECENLSMFDINVNCNT